MRGSLATQRREINHLARVRPLRLSSHMTTVHSMESTMTRRIVSAAVILLAATVAACGGSTQATTGTAPSLVSPIAGATDGAGSFNLLKEGRGKSGHSPAPDIGTTPTTDSDDPETDDAGDSGHGDGHGKAAIQYEGFTKSITGGCPDSLIIAFNDDDTTVTTITTDLTTEFQRATCEALLAAGETPVHLHIAAKKMEDDSLVAIYVRMQGPKFDHGDEAED
jgi:hypothetical protein